MQLGQLRSDSIIGLCLLSVLGVVGLSGLMLLPVLLGAYVDFLGFSESHAGWVTSANLAGIALMSLLVSFQVRHRSLYQIAFWGLILMLLFDALSMLSGGLKQLLFFRFMSGLGGGAVQAVVAAAIARSSIAGRGYGIYIGFQFVLPAIAFYLLPAFLQRFGLNGLMVLLLALELLFLLFAKVLNSYPLPEQASSQLKGTWRSSHLALLISKPSLLSLFALCFYGIANAGFYAYVERFGLHSGLANQQVGDVLALANFLAVAGAALVYYLGDKHGFLRPLSIGIFIQVLSMLCLLQGAGWAYYAGVIVWSLAWAFSWPFFLSMQASLDKSGSVVAAGQCSNLIGNAMGPLIFSFALSADSYVPLITVAIVFFILSLLPMLGVAKYLPDGSVEYEKQ
ncbi:MFS transporter [Pseudoteredinibacter isoporae]|uniref:Putative MFS family arabinose efflux permease n=1 Tax=Pseudoteredinibacter isoporae TaxID=570281 RepID=A0A7X0JSS7_9GAMM|nr:MFS transporter [Pseudoteredinibacter isoporae]MBB6521033.1 putative MFS family arabinose efflux permease [Pseudoteredinibacter isoporae]NHO86597.1 MFS transporter [Pseudoteredinibacter isoporae]NIB24951.1 MFS transporter [Pseudoteredinibacter isoporae]